MLFVFTFVHGTCFLFSFFFLCYLCVSHTFFMFSCLSLRFSFSFVSSFRCICFSPCCVFAVGDDINGAAHRSRCPMMTHRSREHTCTLALHLDFAARLGLRTTVTVIRTMPRMAAVADDVPAASCARLADASLYILASGLVPGGPQWSSAQLSLCLPHQTCVQRHMTLYR